MLLAIDVGNTQTQLGVFDADDRLLAEWRLSTVRDRTADELGLLVRELFALEELAPDAVDAVVYASVVPPLDNALEAMVQRYFRLVPLRVTAAVVDDLPVLYRPPGDVGADRLVNAVAARSEYGAPAVIVDFGTATTFDVIDAEGAYLGGVIATGIGVSADALFARAARLPRVEIARPASAIGRSTRASVQSGLFFGYADLVDGLVGRIVAELGEPARVVGTGGWASTIGVECRRIETIDELLTLKGLRLIHRRAGGRGIGPDAV